MSLAGAQLTVRPASSSAAGAKPKRRKGAKPRRTAFLFTHKGFSGPAVLDLSHLVARSVERGLPVPGTTPLAFPPPSLAAAAIFVQISIFLVRSQASSPESYSRSVGTLPDVFFPNKFLRSQSLGASKVNLPVVGSIDYRPLVIAWSYSAVRQCSALL